MLVSKFSAVFDDIANKVEYHYSMTYNSNYFDGAVYNVILSPGERAKCTGPFGRRAIFVGTRFGTCVFFEYLIPDPEDVDRKVSASIPNRLDLLVPRDDLTEEDLFKFANGSQNIGDMVERMLTPTRQYAAREFDYSSAVEKRMEKLRAS